MPNVREIALTIREIDSVSSPHFDRPLTHDTTHAVIEAAQRKAVMEAMPFVVDAFASVGAYPTEAQLIDAVSHASDLPVWNVHRALSHFEIVSPPKGPLSAKQKRNVGDKRQDKVVKWLSKQTKYMTVLEIAKGTKLTPHQVRTVVSWEPNPFCRIAITTKQLTSNSGRYAYQLKGFKKKQSA